MGGGDLNTKKSWHPNTLKNQERVWKAEQIRASENKRIDDLRKEMDEEKFREEMTKQAEASGVLPEKSNKKLDWMYKEPNQSIDHEQYLLGKAIDKTFEKIKASEQESLTSTSKNHVEHECIPFSIRSLKNKGALLEGQVDIARKLLEDPLVAIHKKEVESRAQLLQNPVKLKQISMLLKEDRERYKKKKEKKKSKKHKKDKSDLEKKIFEKLKKLGDGDKGVDINKLLSSKDFVKVPKKKHKKRERSSSPTDSDSDAIVHESDSTKKNRSNEHSDDQRKKRRSNSRRNEMFEREDDKKYHDKKKDHGENSYGLVRADGSKMEIYHSRTHEKEKFNRKHEEQRWQRPERKKMSEREMDEKRKEMMKDAQKRDREREKNVAYYRAQDKKQELKDKQREFREDFVEKQLRAAAGQSTVESRIKSNIYNIQRSNRDMDKNFAKR